MENETKVLEGDALVNFFNLDGVEDKKEAPTTLEDYFEEGSNPKKDIVVPEPKKEKKDTSTPPAKVEEVISPKTSVYTDLIKEYIEEGDWQDGAIEVEDEKGEIITINLLDLSDVTPDQFKQIKAAQKALREEDFKSKYISIEGLDENTKKIIELKKAGGDTRELFQMQADLVNPLDTLDLDDERVHEYLVRQKLAANPDFDADDIDNKIAKMKANFVLDTEAKKIITEVNTNFGLAIEQRQKAHLETVEKAQAEQKEFKKKIAQTYKDLKLSDNVVKNLVENTAKFDEYGLTNVDKAFFEAKKNPEFFAKIAYLILDEKGFNEFQGVKIKNNVTKETIKTIFKISPKNTKSSITNPDGTLENYFENNK
jgi:hypothetical protein